MKKKHFLLLALVLALTLLLAVGASASEVEDVTALKITPGRTVSVTLPAGVGSYTYNEEIVVLKGFSTDENGETTLLFGCLADIPMGTYDLLYLDGVASMGISVYGMGDANMDGDVSARDVVLIKQAIVGMTELSGTQQVFSNVYDEDEEVNTRDAVLVLQHIVGMDVTLGTPDGDSAVCSGAKLEIIDGYLYATYLDAPDTPVNLGKVKGEDGIGITSIVKTSTEGLVDTYTITYTDGTTTTFTVTNGSQGIQGIQGVPGANGHTPTITIKDGNWFVDGVDTGVAAQGAKGEDGVTPEVKIGEDGYWYVSYDNGTSWSSLGVKATGDKGESGLSAYEIYKKYYSAYTGTEAEWIVALVSGQLESGIYYTVSFETGTDATIPSQSVKTGGKATKPETPTKAGYEFLGWYVNDELWSFVGFSVTDNITLTAKWKEINLAELDFYLLPDGTYGVMAGNAKFAEHITIPATYNGKAVTQILNSAFEGAANLVSITIPDSVTSIGDWAFAWCYNLTSVTIGSSVTSIGDWAFAYCSNLTSVVIPDSVESIGDRAFFDCDNLTNITIGSGVASIGYEAFSHCSNLTSITIPKSVTSIGAYAFYECSGLETIYYLGTMAGWKLLLSQAEDIGWKCTMLCSDGEYVLPSADGDRGPDGSWDAIDFGGQQVILCVSTHQPDAYFPSADRYTKGSDVASGDKIIQAVLKRNSQAAQELNIDVVYQTRNLYYNEAINDVRDIVTTASKNSPDIYNNDMCALTYSMVSGYLWNVKNPGEDVKSFFDFSADGWYEEFMKGATFDQNQYYMFAGDYFIDMLRMANVIYVNNDMLAANSKAFPAWAKSVDQFYEFVEQGYWDIDALTTLSRAVFSDSIGGIAGEADRNDERVGFAYNAATDWIFSAASGVTLYYQDKEDGYKPKVLDDITEYIKVANKYKGLANDPSAYFGQTTLSSAECFLQGNVLFAMARLGEMESEQFRNVSFSKGLVPVPMWEASKQDDYLTVVHDQVEVGAILNTAKAFTAASALMQYLNEESDEVIYTYYEEGLKFRFNEDENTRVMMDLVRDSIDSPFGFQIGRHCQNLYDGAGVLSGLYIESNNIASTFAMEKEAYKYCMQKMIDRFAGMYDGSGSDDDTGDDNTGDENQGDESDVGRKYTVVFKYIDRSGNELFTDEEDPISSNIVPNRRWGSSVSNPLVEDPQAFADYVIVGWNADKGLAQAGIVDESCTQNITSDRTLYSVVRLKEDVTVTLMNGNDVFMTVTVKEGAKLDDSIPKPVALGKYFRRWEAVEDPNAEMQSTQDCIYADCSFKAVMGSTDGTIGKVAAGTIEVDGMKDAEYAYGAYLAHNNKKTSTNAYTVNEMTLNGQFGTYAEPDIKADTWMLWDGDYIYVLIEVYDKTFTFRSDIYIASGADAWLNDAVELWYCFEQDATLRENRNRIGLSALGDIDLNGDGRIDAGSGKYALPRYSYKDTITGIGGGRSTHYDDIQYGVRNAYFDTGDDLDLDGLTYPSYIVEFKIPAWTEGEADMDYAYDEDGNPLTGQDLVDFQKTGLKWGCTPNNDPSNYAFTTGEKLVAGDFVRLNLQINDLRIAWYDLADPDRYLDCPTVDDVMYFWGIHISESQLNASHMLYELVDGQFQRASTVGLFCSTGSTQHNLDYYLMFSLNDELVSETKVWGLGKSLSNRTQPVMYKDKDCTQIYTRD